MHRKKKIDKLHQHFTFVGMLMILASFFLLGWATPQRIYAAGSGQDMMSLKETVQEVIALTGKATPRVLYLGTATYDEAGPQQTQTQVPSFSNVNAGSLQAFVDAGCPVASLSLAIKNVSTADIRGKLSQADIVLVSGGNTLYARDRW